MAAILDHVCWILSDMGFDAEMETVTRRAKVSFRHGTCTIELAAGGHLVRVNGADPRHLPGDWTTRQVADAVAERLREMG
jgi:hypothetical protein